MRLSRRALLAAAGALPLLAARSGLAAEPARIRIGWVVASSNWPAFLFAKEGVARHQGASYQMEDVHFSGTPQMITALASGDLDIATLAYSSFALAVENAKMEDLRVIADDFQDGVPGYYSDEYMVLKDGPIRAVEDLKGKVLATNGAGSAVDIGLRAMLRKHGLEDKRDVTIIEIGLPNMKAVLSEKKADLVCAVTPFSWDPGLRSIARTLFTQKEAVGTTQMIVWAARAGFLEKNRAAMGDFMADALRARHFFLDPAHHTEAVELVAKVARLPPERLEDWLFTKDDYYRDPDGLPNLDALQANVDLQRQLGFLKSGFDVRKYADLALARAAMASVK
ncbi:MAG TPA: ABC transporter substrate-binding protein [Stellaceae bacterium]|nr:ABC transporter substrate-binding protein [Stellaceae bacterium]